MEDDAFSELREELAPLLLLEEEEEEEEALWVLEEKGMKEVLEEGMGG